MNINFGTLTLARVTAHSLTLNLNLTWAFIFFFTCLCCSLSRSSFRSVYFYCWGLFVLLSAVCWQQKMKPLACSRFQRVYLLPNKTNIVYGHSLICVLMAALSVTYLIRSRKPRKDKMWSSGSEGSWSSRNSVEAAIVIDSSSSSFFFLMAVGSRRYGRLPPPCGPEVHPSKYVYLFISKTLWDQINNTEATITLQQQ